MSTARLLADAVHDVRAQEQRVVLLEKMLIMALLGADNHTLVIDPKHADAAERFQGVFDIGSGLVKLVPKETAGKYPSGGIDDPRPFGGVALRTFARTFTDDEG